MKMINHPNYRFNATHLFTQDDGNTMLIAFADDAFEPTQFVILQKAHIYDEQDKKMGMDNIHIQVEDVTRSGYGGINAIEIRKGVMKMRLATANDIEVVLPVDHPAFEEVKLQLRKCVRQRKSPSLNNANDIESIFTV